MAQDNRPRLLKCPERLTTKRLVLRRPTRADADDIFRRYAGDQEVCRFLAWPVHESVDDTLAFIEFSDQEWQRSPAGPYLVFSRDETVLLGSTGLAFESRHQASTGYVFAKDAWGHGFASESLHAMMQQAAAISLDRLTAMCHPEHPASRHVLEKAGFTYEGILEAYCPFPNLTGDELQDVASYSWIPRAKRVEETEAR